jgi:NAD(P)-dependent dehydrogenase (short-subunit alcohol dehydrogenase family)
VQDLQSRYPNAFKYHSGDITNPKTVDDVLQLTLTTFKHVDSVVFNAGIVEPIKKLADVDVNEFKYLMDVNVTSILIFAQKVLGYLRKQENASMVFVSSGAAISAYSGWGPYCISKAALNMMVGGFGKEEPNVTSIAIRPGNFI